MRRSQSLTGANVCWSNIKLGSFRSKHAVRLAACAACERRVFAEVPPVFGICKKTNGRCCEEWAFRREHARCCRGIFSIEILCEEMHAISALNKNSGRINWAPDSHKGKSLPSYYHRWANRFYFFSLQILFRENAEF